ncbi:MAG: hypothetical protein ACXWRE_14395 [Pseudobdellovibrionaceae bacterium]
MKNVLNLFMAIFAFMIINPINAFGNTASSLSQWGITWSFDKAYTYGTYANGDYWVLGPVTITSISPTFTGTQNGWQVNPAANTAAQGFDSRVPSAGFSASLDPALPYTSPSSGTQSVVKAISAGAINCSNDCYPLKTVAVLTIVTSIPANNGATVFRPPYVGSVKPNYSTANLHTELLPAYARTSSALSLSSVLSLFQHVQFGHISPVRDFRPTDNYQESDPYGATVGSNYAQGALGLMFNDSLSAKMPALIAYVQAGIDMYAMMQGGMNWGTGQGYEPNMKLPIYFMAAMFQDPTLTQSVQALPQADTDDKELYVGKNGVVLFGDTEGSEQQYWQNIANSGAGNHEWRDPYGLIDGSFPVDPYQDCCLSQPWKGQALAVQLMPALKAVYNFPILLEYVDRWVSVGLWTKPDTCAPYDGNMNHYGVTFGPDGRGGCIQGSGRFPALHGIDKDGGGYASAMVNEMWAAYRNSPSPIIALNPPTGLRIVN